MQLSDDLDAIVPAASFSEAQGIICGLICGGDADPVGTWLRHIQPGTPNEHLSPEAVRAVLDPFAISAQEAIRDPDLGFTLQLPDEDRPLAERATALYDWVRGFLFALGVLGIGKGDLSGQTREILRDFTDLTRLDLDDLDDREENEEALVEVIEFVRVAALLLYEERAVAPDEMASS
jgi:hypothetical protein